jgi:hypothetical protein
VEEQLAIAVGVVVRDVPLRVLVYARADEPDLAVTQVGVCLAERDPAVTQ